jgi:hypothetical protein
VIERTPLPDAAISSPPARAGQRQRVLVLGHAVWPAGAVAEWLFGNDGKF